MALDRLSNAFFVFSFTVIPICARGASTGSEVTVIAVGESRVQGKTLRPYSSVWTVRPAIGMEVESTVRIREKYVLGGELEEGNAKFELTHETDGEKISTVVLSLDLASLAPRGVARVTSTKGDRSGFKEKRWKLTGKDYELEQVGAAGSLSKLKGSLPIPCFWRESSGLILASLQLTKGQSFAIPVCSEMPLIPGLTAKWLMARVRGRGAIEVDGVDAPCVIVDASVLPMDEIGTPPKGMGNPSETWYVCMEQSGQCPILRYNGPQGIRERE